MVSDTRGAHVIMMPAPAVAHCVPFFHLTARLVHLGLRVTFLVPELLDARIRNDPLLTNQAGEIRRDGVEVVVVKDGFSHLGNTAGLFAMLRAASEAQLVAEFSDAMTALVSSEALPAPCCIVSDLLMGWTQDLAAKFHIPRFILHIQSAANLSLMLHVPTLVAEGRLPLTESNQEKPVHIPGLKVPLSTSELPSDLQPGDLVPESDDIFMRSCRRAKEAPIVLVSTFRDLEDDVFAALDALHANSATQMPKAIPVGPLLTLPPFSKPVDTTVTSKELDKNIMRFMDKHPPQSVVYICFGTVGMRNNEKLFEEIALGLEASGQPFLWADVNHPMATSLAKSLPPGFLDRTKERGMVVNECAPQLRILQHPSAGVFLSHCGWNSTQEAVTSGVPILASPVRAEQKMNARFLVDVAKVAEELQRSSNGSGGFFIPRSELERGVRLVLQEDAGKVLRSNAQTLKASALKAAASLETVQTFVALLRPRTETGPGPKLALD